MATQIISPRQTGLGEFSAGMQPYLQMAFQNMLQQKMKDMELQRKMERLSQTLPGVVEEAPSITPPNKFLGFTQHQPKQYKVNQEALAKLPSGMGFELGDIKYTAPQPSLFSNVTIDTEGNPAIKIGEQLIPLKSLSKTGFTPTGEEKVTEAGIEAAKSLQPWWQNIFGLQGETTKKLSEKIVKQQLGEKTKKGILTLTKPKNVAQSDWDIATDEQKKDLLSKLGLL